MAKIKIKPLTQFINKYRVICPYGYDTHTEDYYFLSTEDGIDEWDYFIPLNIHKKSDDWQAVSNLTLSRNGQVLVYITSGTVGRRCYEEIEGLGYTTIGVDLEELSEVIFFMKYEGLFDKKVMNILKPVVSGKSFSPKSYKNLPSYDPKRTQNYKMTNTIEYNIIVNLMVEKYGENKYKLSYKKVYDLFDEKYKVNIRELAGKESLNPIQYIDKMNWYDKLKEVI